MSSVSGVQRERGERVVTVKRTEADQRQRVGIGDEHTGHQKRQRCLNTSEGISNSRRCSRRSRPSFTDVSEKNKTKTSQGSYCPHNGHVDLKEEAIYESIARLHLENITIFLSTLTFAHTLPLREAE